MTKLNNSPNHLIEEVNKCLKTIVSQFYYNPFLFFNESEQQSYFYSVFYRNKHFSGSNRFPTKDGKKTNLLRLGYGSALGRNVIGENYCYDTAILNPQFILDNNFNRILSKETKYVKSFHKDDLLAIFELKDIRRSAMREAIKKDHRSLKNAKEAKWKYLIVFDSSEKDREIFKGMNFNDINNFRLIHIRVYFDKNNKKKVEVDIRPNNFLNLPTKWLKK